MPFAVIVDPVDFPTPIPQRLPLRSHRRGNFVPATPRARLDSRRGVDVFAFGIGEGEQVLDVPAVPSIDRSTHDLDVLLRHRPPSIPPEGEGRQLRKRREQDRAHRYGKGNRPLQIASFEC